MYSATVAGVAVRGELGWWSLGERREKKKLVYGKKVDQFDENRLVAKVVACAKEIGGKGWWKELENLRGKYGIGDESVSGLMDKVSEKVISDWRSEVEGKVTLGWYQRVKESLEAEKYLDYLNGYGVRVRFRLRTGSGGLMEDLKRCRRKSDARCVLCDEGVVEDIRHFLVECGEFENGRERLMERVGGIEGAESWIEEWRRVGEEGRVLLLLGKRVVGVEEGVGVEVDKQVCGVVEGWWVKRRSLVYGLTPVGI